MSDLTALSELNDNDVLQDLKLRVEQMEASDAQGYDTCKNFYKRIIQRIEKAEGIVPEVALEPVNVGDRFIYTHNGSLVEVTEIEEGRWPKAVLRFVDGYGMFNCGCLIHDLQQNRYGFWERV